MLRIFANCLFTFAFLLFPSLPFFFPFARIIFGYTTTAAKLHFFFLYRKKITTFLVNIIFFVYLCTHKGLEPLCHSLTLNETTYYNSSTVYARSRSSVSFPCI